MVKLGLIHPGTILAWAIVALLSHWSTALPSGFEDQSVARIYKLVDISFGVDRNGKHVAYGVTKRGRVHVITDFVMDDDSAKEEEVLDLRDSVCDDKERGYACVVSEVPKQFSQA